MNGNMLMKSVLNSVFFQIPFFILFLSFLIISNLSTSTTGDPILNHLKLVYYELKCF